MKKRCFSAVLPLFLSLCLTAFLIASTASQPFAVTAVAAEAGENTNCDGGYKEGEAIVTIAAPKRTALAREGFAASDPEINIEAVWDFKDAGNLSPAKSQSALSDDKNLYISLISSDVYSTEELIQKLSGQAGVISAEPNRYRRKMALSNDTFSEQQWYLSGDGAFQTESDGIRYKKTESKKTPVVAVVDTGIDYTHEDLKDHMWKNTYPELQGTYGYDFGDNDSDPFDEDEDGHGTHCAGVIGAVTDNETGIGGIADDVSLMALKVFNNKGEIKDSAIIAAFHYIYQAMQLGVNITAINCSWGGGNSSSAMETLIDTIGAEGALFLFAAGNDATNQDLVSSRRKECPYDMTNDYIVIVGASGTDDRAASFSDYGAQSVDLFAPGSQIFSTVNQPVYMPNAYPEKMRDSLTSFYSDCSEGSLTLYTPEDLNLPSSRVTYGNVRHSSEDFYKDGSGSLYVPFHTSSWLLHTTFSAYLDVSSLALNPSSNYYVACDYTADESDSPSPSEWTHFSRQTSSSDFVTVQGRQYLRLFSIIGVLHSYSGFYIDQVAISTANPDTASFGKYNYMNGTSMAAPVVSGAVAALSAMFPEDSALQRKQRLLHCTRQVSELSAKCKTGGILDMSLFASSTAPIESPAPAASASPSPSPSPSPSSKPQPGPSVNPGPAVSANVPVAKITLNKKTAKLRYKKKMKLRASVTPKNATNKAIAWSVSKKKYAKVTAKGVVTAKKKGIGHTVKVYAAAKDGSGKKAVCRIKIKSKN